MIIIKGKDFEMSQVKDTQFFNLSIAVNGKDGERKEMKIRGYGLPFEDCIKRIVSIKMSESNSTYNVSEYILKYKEIVDSISPLITYKDKEDKEENLN